MASANSSAPANIAQSAANAVASGSSFTPNKGSTPTPSNQGNPASATSPNGGVVNYLQAIPEAGGAVNYNDYSTADKNFNPDSSNGIFQVSPQDYATYKSTGQLPSTALPAQGTSAGATVAAPPNSPNGQNTIPNPALVPNAGQGQLNDTSTGLSGGTSDTSGTQNTQLSAQQQMSQKYNGALSNLQQSGMNPPSSAGAAAGAVSGVTPAPLTSPPNTDAINTAISQSPGIQNLIQQAQQTFSQENQQSTLEQDYQNISNSFGLPAINTQMMDIQNVMNGTEADIRGEITKAGGFATNSQVMALTNARNKGNIQNYNNLVSQQKSAQDQVNTLIGLDEKDKAAATAQLDKQLSTSIQLQTLQNTMQTQTNDTYKSIATSIGWNGLASFVNQTGDPGASARVEQSLGLPEGSLNALSQTTSAASLATQKDQLTIQQLQQQLLTAPTTTAQDQALKALQIQGQQIDNATKAKTLSNLQSGDQLTTQQNTDLNEIKSQLSANKDVQAFMNMSTAMATINSIPPNTTNPAEQQALLAGVAHMLSPGSTSLRGALSALNASAFDPGDWKLMNDAVNTVSAQGSLSPAVVGSLQTFAQSLYSAQLPVYQAIRQDSLQGVDPAVATKVPDFSNLVGKPAAQLVAPVDMPPGYYQASDGLLYKK